MHIKYLNEDCERISKTCDLEFGKELLILKDDTNLLSRNPQLNKSGFGRFTVQDISTFNRLEKTMTLLIKERMELYQNVSDDFQLNQYHKHLVNQEDHFKISTWALDYKLLGSVYDEIKEQVEEILGVKLRIKRINHMGTEGDYVGFRVLRPQKNDHNPFHRDAWIPYWRDTVNIWLPICGFEDGNSLQFIPESHIWPDNKVLKTSAGVEISGKKYHVPAAVGTTNDFTIVTPALQKGDGMIFSPYLIHGNGVNRQDDTTRVSVEFRFCKD